MWGRGGGGRGRALDEMGDLFESVGFFSLEKMMVSVLHKELEYNVEKLKYKKDEDHAAKNQNQIRISPH